MNDFYFDYFFDEAERQYENQLPERYDYEPLFKCDCCNEGVVEGEEYYDVGGYRYCTYCVSKHIAED